MLAWFSKHESTIAFLGALAAVVASGVAIYQAHDAKVASEAQAYLTMRDRYFSVWSELPDGYENLEVTRDDSNFIKFKRYWYVSFDEWYVTQRVGAFDDLWTSYYKDAFIESLEKKGMRVAFCLLKDKEFSTGARREFVDALETAYAGTDSNKRLCD